MSDHELATQVVHAGALPPIEGAVCTPIFQSATYVHSGAGVYRDVRYLRLNNTPNHQVLAARLATICGGESAVVTASGMAAITTALMAMVPSGAHILAQRGVYGGTAAFLAHDCPELGVGVTLVDGGMPETWEAALRPESRVFYLESLSNPLLEVADLEAAVAFARKHGLITMIDNTFPSPVNFRPIPLGFDLEIHSATKYLNGHSDITAGCVVGRRDLVDRIMDRLGHLGGCLDPHSCFLLERGLKTLPLRVVQQNANALALAEHLEAHDAVNQVIYPWLASHPDAARARGLFGGGGGVLSFVLAGDLARADAFIARLKIPCHAPSLGGVETLITRPATTTHAALTPEERADAGISDSLVRVAVGIEGTRDLLADFTQALA